ncbi:MAG TPA: CDP-alcohol phosphatidyltransferase family protein [Phnomibacter sp.]|nr:CDP-alcohol phosphatidyltransferase family protein [Phnomibacter sp.]
MIRQIPNLLTLCNLILGCMAIVFLLQNGWVMVEDETQIAGYRMELQVEQMFLASLCIGLAAVVDFFDGFAARALGAQGEMGVQLDSLADVVSFGVAPSMIIYQLLRLSLAREEDGLSASFIWLVPAFVLAASAAWRLARFNIDKETPSHYFRGTPVPSVGLTIAALPLIWWQATAQWEVDLLTNRWVLYALVGVMSWLMVSDLPIMSNKPAKRTGAGFLPQILVVVLAILAAAFLGWWAVPVTFAGFVFFSIIFKSRIVQ